MGLIDRIVRAFTRGEDQQDERQDNRRDDEVWNTRPRQHYHTQQDMREAPKFYRDQQGRLWSEDEVKANGWVPVRGEAIPPSADVKTAEAAGEPFRWDDEALTWRNREGDEVWDNPDAEPDQLARADARRAQDRPDPNGLTVPAEWAAEVDADMPRDEVEFSERQAAEWAADEAEGRFPDYRGGYHEDGDDLTAPFEQLDEATRRADESGGLDRWDPTNPERFRDTPRGGYHEADEETSNVGMTRGELRDSLERLDPPDQAHDRALIEDAIREAEGIGSIQDDPQAERDLGDRAEAQARYEAAQDADPKGQTAGDGSANLTQLNAIVADMQAQQAAQANVVEVEAAAAQGGQDMAYPPPTMAAPVQQAPTQSAGSGGAA